MDLINLRNRINQDSIRRKILFCAILLTTWGLLVNLSAGSVSGLNQFNDNYHYIKRHFTSIMIGILFYLIVTKLKDSLIIKMTKISTATVSLLLVYVLAHGRQSGGATRWINIGPVNIQPSEFVKIIVILWVAMHLKTFIVSLGSWRNLLRATVVPASLCYFIYQQPDFGTLSVILGILGSMLFFSEISFLLVGCLSLIGVLFMYFLITTSPYRMERILSFLSKCDENSDVLGNCYQLIQSRGALGSGGLSGTGPGTAFSRWGYLPNAHSDFIASIIGEEYGFVGLFLLMIIYFLFIIFLYLYAAASINNYDKYLRLGFASWMLFQTIFNLGGVVGLLPITGIVLPFVSYGGSAMVANFIGLSLALRDG